MYTRIGYSFTREYELASRLVYNCRTMLCGQTKPNLVSSNSVSSGTLSAAYMKFVADAADIVRGAKMSMWSNLAHVDQNCSI